MRLKKDLYSLLATTLIASLTACGVAPSTTVPPAGKKYGDMKDFVCPDGDDDKDNLCNKYEKDHPDLGPQCVADDDCDDDEVPDGEETEHKKWNTGSALIGLLVGVVGVTALEATSHPIQNVQKWLKRDRKGDDQEVVTPAGSYIIKGNQYASSEMVTHFAQEGGKTIMRYYSTATFTDPVIIEKADGSAYLELNDSVIACLISELKVAAPAASGAGMKVTTELQLPANLGEVTLVVNDANFKTNCTDNLDAQGLYLSYQKEGQGRIRVTQSSGYDLGFVYDEILHLNRKANVMLLENLDTPANDGSLANVQLRFVEGNYPGPVFKSLLDNATVNAMYTKAPTCGTDKTCKVKRLLQNVDTGHKVKFKADS